jgi:hypothetical protein
MRSAWSMFSQKMMVLAKRSWPEELGDFGGDQSRALFKDEIAVEVAVVVFAVLDELPVFVG